MRALATYAARHLRGTALAVALLAGLTLPQLASGHLERPSYWPDPAPDTAVSPPAGGEVPKPRSLASAVTGEGPGEVRVVCKGSGGATSLRLAERSIALAERKGFRLRPSLPRKRYSSEQAREMLEINRALADQCAFGSVQAAINASGNNDRVVIMPGRYTEPSSRRAPTNDPKCNPSLLQASQTGDLTPSYEYQATCPNDQNLIYVQGRAVAGDPLESPRPDRHGIPEQELGRCIRCNLQIEGSGPKPEDVLLDAGRGYENPQDPDARPGGDRPVAECHPPADQPNPCYTKHVVMRTDRSDGFVGRNFLVRGAKEHGFYTEETDGILLDRVKFFWNADYGHLSFTTDHNVVRNCDGYGAGDSVVYPGASPQTGDFRDESVYPESRYNTVIRRCDLHGSVMGYSGSMGNSVRVTQNHFYGNVNGLTSDTISPEGHPGYPADGMKIDRNWFYSNNLDIYRSDPPFDPLIPEPVGTGMIYFGYNDATVTRNWFFDNWRQGTMLQAAPDAVIAAGRGALQPLAEGDDLSEVGLAEPDGNVDEQFHCPNPSEELSITSTSCDNQYFANHMGQIPPTFRAHPGLTKFGNRTGLLDKPRPDQAPNGIDFWWDEFPGNTGNCWYDNQGPDGTRESLRSNPPQAPVAGMSLPGFLPEDCSTSVGAGVVLKSLELVICFVHLEAEQTELPTCDWFNTPARPGTAAARAERRDQRQVERELLRTPQAAALEERLREVDGLASPDAPR